MLRVVPMLAVMGTIFFISHQPGDSFELPEIINLDKLLHGIAYGVLAATVLYATPLKLRKKSLSFTAVLAMSTCLLYGISDEFHQSFIPGRYPSIWDIIADLLGAALVVWLWRRRAIVAQGDV
jgi:VanZ family protein